MEQNPVGASGSVVILSCDGDPTIREGDWLHLWNSVGMEIAHDVWVGRGGVVYENSGPGGCVRRNSLANVLVGRRVIHIAVRTPPHEFAREELFAESKVGTLWDGFYNCQDFASEVATGVAQSFQREAVIGLALLVGSAIVVANLLQTHARSNRRV